MCIKVMKNKIKLIEKGLPLEVINKGAYDENRKQSNPKKIHVYFARRKYVAARAIIFAQLVDDPTSDPIKFPTLELQNKERERLYQIISKLVIWENFNNQEVLNEAIEEIKKSCGNILPKICDAFSGSGLISLEAKRLGLTPVANDLNPVAYMITKGTVEIPSLFRNKKPVHLGAPKKLNYINSDGLAEDVQYYANRLLERVYKRVSNLYPPVRTSNDKTSYDVIAWIWARTIPSPDPSFKGAQVPLARTFLLSSKGKGAFIRPKIDKLNRKISYEVINGGSKEDWRIASEGTKIKNKTNFRCILSGASIDTEYIKKQIKENQMSCHLIGVICSLNNSRTGQIFLSPNEEHQKFNDLPRPAFEDDIKISENFNIKKYGFEKFSELFTNRQLKMLNTFVEEINDITDEIKKDISEKKLELDGLKLSELGTGNYAYSQAIKVYLTFLIDQLAHHCSSACTWHTGNSQLRNIFNKPTISTAWDFAEINPFSGRTGSFQSMLKGMIGSFSTLGSNDIIPEIIFGDAIDLKYDEQTVISTDPPYYDNIGYADLSDFFYSWMKRCLKDVYPSIFGLSATPKSDELVVDPKRHGSKKESDKFFINGMSKVITNMANHSSKDFPACIYYAYANSEKSNEGISAPGWVSFLTSIISSGYSVVATWPVRLEQNQRMTANGTNALATSLLVICKKNENKKKTVTEKHFIDELRNVLPPAIDNLKSLKIAPADLPQCSIGPGIGIFSNYEKVLETDDSPMTVKRALQLINRELSESKNEYDEITTFAIKWFKYAGFTVKPFDDARNIANSVGLSINEIVSSGIASSSGGKFNLKRRKELNPDWDPLTDKTLTVWECCQYLIYYYNHKGINEASKLFYKINSLDSESLEKTNLLAYDLFDISTNILDIGSVEASEYNNLITNWSKFINYENYDNNNQIKLI